jgi:hypothetical protein
MKLIILFMLASLAGCAIQPAPLSSDAGNDASAGFGTLADANNPVEMAAATVINRVALVRYSASRALKRGNIYPDDARELLFCTDHVINDLNGAIKAKNLPAIKTARQAADACSAQLGQAQKTRHK